MGKGRSGGGIRITIKAPCREHGRGCKEHAHYYRYDASLAWVRRYDNGALISCGATVGEGGLKRVPAGAVETSFDQWNHSSCQSGCVLRGDAKCRW